VPNRTPDDLKAAIQDIVARDTSVLRPKERATAHLRMVLKMRPHVRHLYRMSQGRSQHAGAALQALDDGYFHWGMLGRRCLLDILQENPPRSGRLRGIHADLKSEFRMR